MSEYEPYQHEDIEALLMSKAFSELLEEEKAFVLQHVRDEAEYASLRELLLQMHELSFDAELKDPPESLETALLHGFAENAEKERGYTRRFSPWIGWAIAATIVGFCIIFFWPSSEKQPMAEKEKTNVPVEAQQDTANAGSPQSVEIEPVISVPQIKLPSEVERLLAEVKPAIIPDAPPAAERLYENDEEVKSVAIVEEDATEQLDAPPTAAENTAAEESEAVMEDVSTKSAVAPAMPESKTVQLSTTTTSNETTGTSDVLKESLGREKASRKKRRNPDAMNIAQSKKLRSLLRSN